MLAYKKRHAAKSDPVKEILSRREARQNQTGLSLYTKRNTLDDVLAPPIQQIGGKNTHSSTKKSTIPRFADLTAARQNAQKRLKAGGSRTGECDYCEARRERAPFSSSGDWANNHVINVTFPSAALRSIEAVGARRFNQGFSGNSTSDLRGAELNINPFGYMRRTQAFEPTQMSYVVEWPKTWPLKIMSFQQRSRPDQRRNIATKTTKVKGSQGSASDKGSAPETLAHPGSGAGGSKNQAVSKATPSRLPALKDSHKPSVKAPESSGGNIGTKEISDASRRRQSREMENRAASSSVAESTYIALQNDNTQDSTIDSGSARQPTQRITAPPSSPCVSNDVGQHKGEPANTAGGENGEDKSLDLLPDVGSEDSQST